MYGNVKTETKPNGAVYTFDYDLMNRKIKTWFREDAQGTDILLEEYEYRILSDKKTQTVKKVYINDSEMLSTIYTYDYAGRLQTQQNPDGTVQSWEYYPNGTLKSATDQKGNKTYYSYDGQNRLSEQWTPVENNGGIKYSYKKITYDSAGRQKQILIGRELVSLYSVPSTFAVTNFTYYRNGLLKSKTDNEGRRVEYRYDSDGNLAAEDVYIDDETFERTEYENNHMGKPVVERKYIRKGDLYGNPFNDNETEIIYTWFTYDSNGNLKTVTNHNGITTTYAYDNMNRQISVSMPGEDEYGTPVTICNTTQYNWEGKVIYTEDANGNVSGYEYDKRGFLTRVINAEGGIAAFWYDRAGRVIAEVSPEHYDESKVLSQMNRKEYTYDSMSRVLAETEVCFDESKNQWISFVSKAYQYDANGNVTKELDALGYEYGTGSTVQQKISTGYGTEYTYNLNNQVISILDPVSKQKGLNYRIKYAYDAFGRVITETNAKGHIISYEYDDAGNLLKNKVQRDTNSPKQVLETYNYDYIGRLISKTDGNQNTIYFEYNGFNNSHTYVYDPLNRLIEKRDPYGKVIERLEYNNNHAQVKSYDAFGNLTRYEYDRNNRLVKTIDPEGNETTQTYDHLGNVSSKTDGRGNTTYYHYDEMNRLEKVVNAKGEVMEYTFDPNGNMLTQKDGNGHITTYEYNCANLVVKRIDHGGRFGTPGNYTYDSAKVESYTYNADGSLATRTDRNGETTIYTYDCHGRLIRETVTGSSISYTYDNNGNQPTVTDSTGTTARTYDELNRVTSKTVPYIGTVYHEYDIIDGVETGETAERTIDPKGNVTTKIYDRAGRLKVVIDGSLSSKLVGNPADEFMDPQIGPSDTALSNI